MKHFALIFCIFYSGSFFGQNTKIFSQVSEKLQRDTLSFWQFVELGKLNCTDLQVSKKDRQFLDHYISIFNQLYPFPRLIDDTILQKVYRKFNKRYLIRKNKCSKVYSVKNPNLKTLYINFVKDKNSYHREGEYGVDEAMVDYLENYFIRIATK